MFIFRYDMRKVYKILLTCESNSVLEMVHEGNLKLEIHAGGVKQNIPILIIYFLICLGTKDNFR